MDPSLKRKFDGCGDWGYHGGHWGRSRGHGPRNSEGQHHRNGVRFGGGRGGHSDGRDVNNGRGGGARGSNSNNTNPHTKKGRECGAAVRTFGKELFWRRKNN